MRLLSQECEPWGLPPALLGTRVFLLHRTARPSLFAPDPSPLCCCPMGLPHGSHLDALPALFGEVSLGLFSKHFPTCTSKAQHHQRRAEALNDRAKHQLTRHFCYSSDTHDCLYLCPSEGPELQCSHSALSHAHHVPLPEESLMCLTLWRRPGLCRFAVLAQQGQGWLQCSLLQIA